MRRFVNDLIESMATDMEAKTSIFYDIAPDFLTLLGIVLLAFAYAIIMRHCEGWRSKIFTKDEIDKIKEKL